MTETQSPPSVPLGPAQPAAIPSRRSKSSKPGIWIVSLLVAAGILWLLLRPHGDKAATTAGHLQVVAVNVVTREDLAQTLTLSAEFRPYQQVALHAKVAGYLQMISVDVGDHVHEGDTIARLDVPEMQDELGKAKAALGAGEQDVTRAEASYLEAHTSLQRLQQVAKEHPKLVAQQDIDTAVAKDATSASAVGAAQQKVQGSRSEVSRVKAMLAYMNITAPFDGVVTKRLADPGALIQAGTSSTQSMPIIELAQDKRLRLVFPVPESAVSLVKVGSPVRISVGAVSQTFDGKVARFSDKVDHATRTMWTEVDVENPDRRFKPGMIANAELRTNERANAIAVPIQAVSSGEKTSVLVVDSSDLIVLRPVKLGLQTPSKAEVLEGLNPGDRVIVGSRAGIIPGQKVVAKDVPMLASE